MSWKLLLRQDAVHGLGDDMESLIWIILYCALRWLPHDVDEDELPGILFEVFEKSAILPDFTRGGEAKFANALDRRITRDIVFHTPVQAWLQTVMDYHRPPPRLFEELKGRWKDPEYLDDFWSQFLQTNRLPAGDRCIHDVDGCSDAATPLMASVMPHSPPVLSDSSNKRRSAAVEDGSPGNALKRRRRQPTVQEAKPRDGGHLHRPLRRLRDRHRGTKSAVDTRRKPVIVGEPSTKAYSAESRYSLRPPGQVVSKYRRP